MCNGRILPTLAGVANVRTLPVPECARCNALCCRVSIIPLDDRYAWDRAVIEAGEATRREIEGGEQWVIARQTSGSCVHLDEATNRCRIYARRPVVCRTWGCFSREDATKLGMSAVEAGIDPLGSPPLLWLRQVAVGAWRMVARASRILSR